MQGSSKASTEMSLSWKNQDLVPDKRSLLYLESHETTGLLLFDFFFAFLEINHPVICQKRSKDNRKVWMNKFGGAELHLHVGEQFIINVQLKI